MARLDNGAIFIVVSGIVMVVLSIGLLAFTVTTPSGTDDAIVACRYKGGVPLTEIQGHAVVVKDCKFQGAR